MFNASPAVGLLFHVDGATSSFLGTCFAFRRATHFITAAHCTGSLPPKQLAIGLPLIRRDGAFAVASVDRHHEADLAVLRLAASGSDAPGLDPFPDFATGFTMGDQFYAFGFPQDVFGERATQPTARLFRGHFQRYMRHQSRHGFHYNAGEMSIGAPAGLSGGPVFRLGDGGLVAGLVTENRESTTFLDSVEEIQTDGKTQKKQYVEVINYGVSLLLDSLGEWLATQVPKL